MCIPVYMCADGTAPHLCIPPVGVEVWLGTTADGKCISHMASSKTQKRTLEDYLSDDENTQTKNFWPHFFSNAVRISRKKHLPLYLPLPLPKAFKAYEVHQKK